MGKFCNKPNGRPSKRKPLNLKHKIEKKVKQHHKKVRKQARQMKALGIIKKKNPKNIEIPNLFPFKTQLIENLQRKKQEAERQKQIEKLQSKQLTDDLDLNNAQIKSEKFEENLIEETKMEDQIMGTESNDVILKGGKKYFKEVMKVIESSDIILEVLDARDPLNCRCKNLEAKILGLPGDKKIILVLNKIDLVPTGNVDAWLKYLRREFATVLFKANHQDQKSKLDSVTLYKKSLLDRDQVAENIITTEKAVGVDNLLQLIKNYSKQEGIKTAVTVGVIGYPNVGKSSLINSLKRSKSCGVSSTPGYTKNIQEIQIDSKVKILDCPGVIFDDNQQKSASILRNIIKVEEIDDPIPPVEQILKSVQKNDLLLLYKIADFSNTTEFLINVALSRGKLKKGGAPDLENAGKLVLQDWNFGKIKYYTIPPSNPDTSIVEEPILIQNQQSVNEQ